MSFLTDLIKYRPAAIAAGAYVGVGDAGEVSGASPSASASVNATAINTALAAGGLVTLTTPGTFLVNATLVIPSNTRFVLGSNTTIKLAPSSNCSLVKNSTATGAMSSITGITSSADLATVNWVAHGLAVGDYFTVLGMAQNDYAGVWKVATVTDADHFTYYLETISATSPCTGTIVGKKVDHDITIEGGIFDWDQANQTAPGTIDAHAINMVNMANYKEYGVRVINNYKYSRNLNNTRDTYCKDGSCYSYVNGADGWHIIGPQRGEAVFENLTGTTGDDFIGITTGDVPSWTAYAGANQIEGDISLVRIINVKPLHVNHSIVKFDGSTANNGYVTKTCEIDGLHGSSIDSPVFVLILSGAQPLQGTHVNTLSIKNATAKTLTAGSSLVEINNAAIVDKLTVNVVRANTNGAGAIVRAAATSTVTQLEVRDLQSIIGTGSSSVIDMSSGATYGQILLDNYRVTATGAGNVLRLDGAVTSAIVSNGYLVGGFGSLVTFSGSGSPAIHLENCSTGAQGGGVNITATAYLFTKNWYHNSGTTAVTIGGGTNEWHGEVIANVPLSVSSGTVKPNGAGIRIATTLATYKLGYTYFDTTLNKLRVGGSSAWETVSSS